MEPLYLLVNKTLYKINNTIVSSDAYPDSSTSSIGSVFSINSGTLDPSDIISGSIAGNLEYTGGYIQSGNFVTGSAGWKLSSDGSFEGNSGTFRGTVTVSSIDIGGDDATSAHIDSSGNFWTGAAIAGFSTAPARIGNDGAAVFSNVKIGGSSIQFTANDNGLYSFGDGSDGAGVADGSTALAGATLAANVYTLTRDVYYTNLTISTGVTIKPSGYRIFGTGTLTMNGTAIILRNGNNGSNGANGSGGVGGAGGSGGAALADGYLKGSVAGATGGTGAAGGGGNGNAGSAGTATSNSIGSNGTAGGQGGKGGGGNRGAGGAGGVATASNVKLSAGWHLTTLLDISASGSSIKYDNSAGAGGGGGGASSTAGGGGGGGASSGGVIAIYFRAITIGASASITANGAAGGNGGDGQGLTDPGDGGGGGGAGGNGGEIIIVYNTLTNNGSVTATAGLGGSPGASGSQTGSSGSNGTAGNIRYFQISL